MGKACAQAALQARPRYGPALKTLTMPRICYCRCVCKRLSHYQHQVVAYEWPGFHPFYTHFVG